MHASARFPEPHMPTDSSNNSTVLYTEVHIQRESCDNNATVPGDRTTSLCTVGVS